LTRQSDFREFYKKTGNSSEACMIEALGSIPIQLQEVRSDTSMQTCLMQTRVNSEDFGGEGPAPMGLNNALSENSLAGWDVLTEVPSEAADADQMFLQRRVHELEAEVERLKLALLQQRSTCGPSTSQGTAVSSAPEIGNAVHEAAGTDLPDEWLLSEDAADVTEAIPEAADNTVPEASVVDQVQLELCLL
jgi:hypothetical protein